MYRIIRSDVGTSLLGTHPGQLRSRDNGDDVTQWHYDVTDRARPSVTSDNMIELRDGFSVGSVGCLV